MVVLAFLGSQCTKFHAAGWTCWFLASFYLESCGEILRWIRQRNNIKLCVDLGDLGDPDNDYISAQGRKHKPYTESLTHRDRKRRNRWRAKQRAHSPFWHQYDCSQSTHPGRPNSEFRILLWCFMATAWKCAKTSPRTLETKELSVASRQRTVSYFLSNQGFFFFYEKHHYRLHSPSFSVSPIEDKT
jgi:hypothetical protein